MRRALVLLGLVGLVAVGVLAVTLLLRGSGTDASPPEPAVTTGVVTGVVTGIVDGDTLDVDGVGRVRLAGIDTPERGECGFVPATDALADLVLGETVSLVPGPQDDSDRYGRLLRYVEVDGADAGLALLEAGLAVARYDSRDGYGEHPREQTYVRADAAAESTCAGRQHG